MDKVLELLLYITSIEDDGDRDWKLIKIKSKAKELLDGTSN